MSTTIRRTAFEADVNGNDHSSSKSVAEVTHLKDSADRLKLLELSLQNALSMVTMFCLCYIHSLSYNCSLVCKSVFIFVTD